MPPPTIYLACGRFGRIEVLERRYPDLLDDGYFCYTHDWEKCEIEGLLEGRLQCKICKEKHWKRGWPKEWRLQEKTKA